MCLIQSHHLLIISKENSIDTENEIILMFLLRHYSGLTWTYVVGELLKITCTLIKFVDTFSII